MSGIDEESGAGSEVTPLVTNQEDSGSPEDWFVEKHEEVIDRDIAQRLTGQHTPLEIPDAPARVGLRQSFLWLTGVILLLLLGLFFYQERARQQKAAQMAARAAARAEVAKKIEAARAAAKAACVAAHGKRACQAELRWRLIDRSETEGAPMVKIWMSEGEVTTEDYGRCVEAGKCSEPRKGLICNWRRSGYEKHPINCVSWEQAKEFARWLGARLPTDAEWLSVTAGPAGEPKPWGAAPASCELAFFADENGEGCGTQTMARPCSRPLGKSKDGLCDLLGGVWEWLEDAPPAEADDSATRGRRAVKAAPHPMLRFVRGGGWRSPATELTMRTMLTKTMWRPDLGFRLVLSTASSGAAPREATDAAELAPKSP
ncbi:MAG: formylglycine-generating enzyme family protein [Myxococcota bacterium]|nr:formylglycine-generating enzyme family protein [Myxococcota bacterium]